MRVATAAKLDLDDVRSQIERLIVEGRTVDLVQLVLGLLTSMQDRSTFLELEIGRLIRKHLGKTSERVSDAQLDLLRDLLGSGEGEASETAPTLPPPEAELPEPKKRPQKGHGRKPLPEHLPRVEVEHRVPDAERPCPHCGAERVCIGHETSEQLEYVPASFRVIVDKREKLACGRCDQGVVVAPPVEKVIDKGRPGPGLLAQVVVAKYADHLPLTRQQKIYAREGVDLPVSTMVDWVAAVHGSVAPLALRIGELALASHVLQADDTGIKVLDKDAPGGAKRGHLWCYVGDATWSVYRYAPDWCKEEPHSFLKTRRGWLVADAYKGYDDLFTRPDATAIEVACWAHARRPFAELALDGDPRAGPILEHIRVMYAVESRATEDAVDAEERLARRGETSSGLVDQIVGMCGELRGRYPPSDALARAAGYVINQQRALARFLEDGRLPIDNTLVERRLRPIAIGRRNYLFCGSDTGADRAASAYTLLGCCALAGVDPRAYLTWVLTQLELCRFPASRIDELLPANWAKVCPPTARIHTSR